MSIPSPEYIYGHRYEAVLVMSSEEECAGVFVQLLLGLAPLQFQIFGPPHPPRELHTLLMDPSSSAGAGAPPASHPVLSVCQFVCRLSCAVLSRLPCHIINNRPSLN